MSAVRLASRYAKSLLDLSIEKGQLEEVFNDMKQVKQVIEASRELEVMLKNPIINAEKKQKVVEAIFGKNSNYITKAFLDLMVKKGREPYLWDIAKSFIALYNINKNITPVKLTTAVAFDKDFTDNLIAKLKTKTGIQNPQIKVAVDESLIGGFVLQYGDTLYDASVSRKLELLEKNFSKNPFVKAI
ncbi:ATP synthase F1 subunit delta [soil metagenome]